MRNKRLLRDRMGVPFDILECLRENNCALARTCVRKDH